MEERKKKNTKTPRLPKLGLEMYEPQQQSPLHQFAPILGIV